MQTKITKTIRVSIDVKQHLDEMKGSVSASEFIETMLSYFERNGVDPRTSINGKFKTLELQGIERIIKIIIVEDRRKTRTGCQAAGKRFRPEELQEGGKRNRLFCRTGLSGNVVI